MDVTQGSLDYSAPAPQRVTQLFSPTHSGCASKTSTEQVRPVEEEEPLLRPTQECDRQINFTFITFTCWRLFGKDYST